MTDDWRTRICEGYPGHVCHDTVYAKNAKTCRECNRQRHILNARAYREKHRAPGSGRRKGRHTGAKNVVYLESQDRKHDRKCKECGKPCWPNFFRCKRCSRPSLADEDWTMAGYGV